VKTKLQIATNLLALAAALFAAATLGRAIGEYSVISRVGSMVKHDLIVAQNRGYVIGCKAAINGYIGVHSEDEVDPIWTEWCVKSAMNFAKQSETK